MMRDKFSFFSRSADKPPGKGAQEQVEDPGKYAVLRSIANWRQMLSNFHECPFRHEGLTYRSIEHGFQAAKTRLKDPQKAMLFALESGSALSRGDGAAARAERKMVTLKPPDLEVWYGMSKRVMESLARAKYAQCPDAMRALLATGDAELWHMGTRGTPAVRFTHLERLRDSSRGNAPRRNSTPPPPPRRNSPPRNLAPPRPTPPPPRRNSPPSANAGGSDILRFFSKSADKPPGKGPDERVAFPQQYATLAAQKDWRQILSNFHVCPFVYKKRVYRTIEHAFQAAKIAIKDPGVAEAFTVNSGTNLGARGGGVEAREQRKIVKLSKDQVAAWDAMSMDVMRDIAIAKYRQCDMAMSILLATRGAQLWHAAPRMKAVRFTHLEDIRDSGR